MTVFEVAGCAVGFSLRWGDGVGATAAQTPAQTCHPSESWDPSPHRASVRSPRVRPVMQISNAMLVDEIRHALQTRPDRLVRGGVAKADMLAIALHAGTEMNIGQHGHTGLVE